MEKRLIVKEKVFKYYRVSLPLETPNSGNVNFEKLLNFIGTHKPYLDRNPIGSAYMIIRQKTDQILELRTRNPILKTSKREIAAIRLYYKNIINTRRIYVKIPFKVAYIFKAIVQIIEEIHNDGYEIPSELIPFVDTTYLAAFYKEYADAYDDCRDDIPIDKEAERALNGDFHDENSPLNSIFR